MFQNVPGLFFSPSPPCFVDDPHGNNLHLELLVDLVSRSRSLLVVDTLDIARSKERRDSWGVDS
jgi:hypothetical protein